jgi:polysaccharide pyruvyl transferase WcaK-like protein
VKQKYKLSYASNYNEVIKAIAESKIVIAERLHACISTMKLNRPIVSLSYSSKVFSMMNDYSVRSLVNLRKDIKNINYSDLIRDALAMEYKKPHPDLDKVLVDVLLEN